MKKLFTITKTVTTVTTTTITVLVEDAPIRQFDGYEVYELLQLGDGQSVPEPIMVIL